MNEGGRATVEGEKGAVNPIPEERKTVLPLLSTTHTHTLENPQSPPAGGIA